MSETEQAPQSTEITMGLRFRRGQARVIRNLADRLKPQGPKATAHVELFEKAAESAEEGVPLIVRCSHPAEATEMADLFTLYGLGRPAVEHFGSS